MMQDVQKMVEDLYRKDHKRVYGVLLDLQKMSEESDVVYGYFDRYMEMIEDENSYVRVRGLLLVCANAKWDTEHKIEENLDKIIAHAADVKPAVSRQFLQALPQLIVHKPMLKEDIIRQLKSIDISGYKESMRQLVYRDIERIIQEA